MANDTHIGLGQAQGTCDFAARLLMVESHDDNGSLALFEGLDATGQDALVNNRHGRLGRAWHVAPKLLEQALFSLRTPAQVEHGHAADSEDIGSKLFVLEKAASAEGFKSCNENLLHQIFRFGFIPKVTQTVEPDARGHAAEQLGFGGLAGTQGDQAHELGVFKIRVHEQNVNHFTLYV